MERGWKLRVLLLFIFSLLDYYVHLLFCGHFNSISINKLTVYHFYEWLMIWTGGGVLLLVAYLVLIPIDRVLPWESNLARRILVQSLVVTAVSVGVTIGIPELFRVLIFKNGFYCYHPLPQMVVSILLGLLVTSMLSGVYFFRQWRGSVVAQEKLKKESVQTQLESLKNQVNPHFLFNSLNTLSTLIDEDPKLAGDFVAGLAQVYRYMLQSNDKELINLRDEIKFISAYIFLVKMRFGESLHIHVNIESKILQLRIPPLTLQILLENAIKHNIISKEKPLFIDIYVLESNKLVVKNNYQPKSFVLGSSGIGLANINARYKLLSEEDISIYQDNDNFVVTLPLVE